MHGLAVIHQRRHCLSMVILFSGRLCPRTCFIFGHGMWPTQEPPCRFQITCFQISRFAQQSVNFFHLALDMAMQPRPSAPIPLPVPPRPATLVPPTPTATPLPGPPIRSPQPPASPPSASPPAPKTTTVTDQPGQQFPTDLKAVSSQAKIRISNSTEQIAIT